MDKFLPFIGKHSIRHFSLGGNNKSICWPKPDYGPMEVQRTQMLNGLKLAAAKPLGGQIAACTVMYQAGSRYEIGDYLGATHFIRRCTSASGCGYTAFSKMRVLQQNGGYITCSSDRQSIAFTLRCPLTTFPRLKYYLLDVAARCCYNQWEIDDRRHLVSDDLARVHPEQRVLDLVQRASFTGPLSNSIFCEEEKIDMINQDDINCFAKHNMRSDTCSVASVGVPYEETLKMAEKIEVSTVKPEPRIDVMPIPRAGFDFYDMGPNAETWIAVAVPGTGCSDFSCLLKHAIVAAACGTGNVQVGQHLMDRTPQTPLGLMSGNDIYTEYKAFNISYWDTGIFGIVAKTRACSAATVASAAAEFLANVGDLDFKQIEIGKQRLKVSLALHDDDCVRVSEGLALQIANGMQIDSAKNSICMIDQISPDEVTMTTQLLSRKCSQMAVAVVGDVAMVPLGRELL